MTAPHRRPLHCRQAPAACHRPAPGQAEAPPAATMGGLAEAIALITARTGGTRLPLSADVAPAATIGALVILAAALLAEYLPDHGARLLEGLGLDAAREDTL